MKIPWTQRLMEDKSSAFPAAPSTSSSTKRELAFKYGIHAEAKYVGSMEVGSPSCQEDVIRVMREIRTQFRKKGVRKVPVEFIISVYGVKVKRLPKRSLFSKKRDEWDEVEDMLLNHPLYRVYYVCHDSHELNVFSYVTRDYGETSQTFVSHVFKTDKREQAVQIVYILCESFEMSNTLMTREDGPASPNTRHKINPEKLPDATRSISSGILKMEKQEMPDYQERAKAVLESLNKSRSLSIDNVKNSPMMSAAKKRGSGTPTLKKQISSDALRTIRRTESSSGSCSTIQERIPIVREDTVEDTKSSNSSCAKATAPVHNIDKRLSLDNLSSVATSVPGSPTTAPSIAPLNLEPLNFANPPTIQIPQASQKLPPLTGSVGQMSPPVYPSYRMPTPDLNVLNVPGVPHFSYVQGQSSPGLLAPSPVLGLNPWHMQGGVMSQSLIQSTGSSQTGGSFASCGGHLEPFSAMYPCSMYIFPAGMEPFQMGHFGTAPNTVQMLKEKLEEEISDRRKAEETLTGKMDEILTINRTLASEINAIAGRISKVERSGGNTTSKPFLNNPPKDKNPSKLTVSTPKEFRRKSDYSITEAKSDLERLNRLYEKAIEMTPATPKSNQKSKLNFQRQRPKLTKSSSIDVASTQKPSLPRFAKSVAIPDDQGLDSTDSEIENIYSKKTATTPSLSSSVSSPTPSKDKSKSPEPSRIANFYQRRRSLSESEVQNVEAAAESLAQMQLAVTKSESPVSSDTSSPRHLRNEILSRAPDILPTLSELRTKKDSTAMARSGTQALENYDESESIDVKLGKQLTGECSLSERRDSRGGKELWQIIQRNLSLIVEEDSDYRSDDDTQDESQSKQKHHHDSEKHRKSSRKSGKRSVSRKHSVSAYGLPNANKGIGHGGSLRFHKGLLLSGSGRSESEEKKEKPERVRKISTPLPAEHRSQQRGRGADLWHYVLNNLEALREVTYGHKASSTGSRKLESSNSEDAGSRKTSVGSVKHSKRHYSGNLEDTVYRKSSSGTTKKYDFNLPNEDAAFSQGGFKRFHQGLWMDNSSVERKSSKESEPFVPAQDINSEFNGVTSTPHSCAKAPVKRLSNAFKNAPISILSNPNSPKLGTNFQLRFQGMSYDSDVSNDSESTTSMGTPLFAKKSVPQRSISLREPKRSNNSRLNIKNSDRINMQSQQKVETIV